MCLLKKTNLCKKIQFTGFSVNGGFAEFMVADARTLLPIPESADPLQFAPFLCAGIVGLRAVRRSEILAGDHVGLFGFGASAHLMLQVLKWKGCIVSVFTRSKKHQHHAFSLGADWVGLPDQFPPKMLDKAIMFTPSGETSVCNTLSLAGSYRSMPPPQ